MAKKFSLNFTKIWAQVNSDRVISKKLVPWPLDGALAQESKNKLQRAEKNAGTPRHTFLIFIFWKIISYYFSFWRENWCFRMLLMMRRLWSAASDANFWLDCWILMKNSSFWRIFQAVICYNYKIIFQLPQGALELFNYFKK